MITSNFGLHISMPQGTLAAAATSVDPSLQDLQATMTAFRKALDGIQAQNLAFFQEYGWQGIGALAGGTVLVCILIAWIVSRLFARNISSFGTSCVYIFVSWGMAVMMSVFTAFAIFVSFGILESILATVVTAGIGFLMVLYFAGIWPWQRIFDLSFNKSVAALLCVLALNVLAQYGATLGLQSVYGQALANHPSPAIESAVDPAAAPAVVSVTESVAAAVAEPQPQFTVVTIPGAAPVKPEAIKAEVHRLYTELSGLRATLDTGNEWAVREFNKKAAIYADLKRQLDEAGSTRISTPSSAAPASGVTPISVSAGVPTT